jgi:hypothetical protein
VGGGNGIKRWDYIAFVNYLPEHGIIVANKAKYE